VALVVAFQVVEMLPDLGYTVAVFRGEDQVSTLETDGVFDVFSLAFAHEL
jgi:hypothetical protein